MLPAIDPKAFATLDLRKYHIRTIQDVIKFNEFVASRMDEAQHILKKFNTKYATLRGITEQMQKKAEEDAKEYGAPTQILTAEGQIQSIDEPNTTEQEHAALLDDIRQAAAEEALTPTTEGETEEDRIVVELDKYRVVMGKKGPMFYRNNGNRFVLVSRKDLPEQVAENLIELANAQQHNTDFTAKTDEEE